LRSAAIEGAAARANGDRTTAGPLKARAEVSTASIFIGLDAQATEEMQHEIALYSNFLQFSH